MKTFVILLILIAAAIALYFYFVDRGAEVTPTPTSTPSPTTTPTTEGMAEKPNLIRVFTPRINEVVKSPLVIEGEARGNWFFEASFPVKILDATGRQLGVIPAQAQGEWMTTNFVPFKATLQFQTPSTTTGTLVLEKDNPSGLPQFADELRIPVRFDLSSFPQKTIKLYYYK